MNHVRFCPICCFIVISISSTVVGGLEAAISSSRPSSFDDYYTSLVGVQSLARNELDLVSNLFDYRDHVLETLAVIDNYLDDFTESILPIVKTSAKLRDKFGDTSLPIIQDAEDMEYVSEQVSSNPILVFKMLRRFVSGFEDIRGDSRNMEHHLAFKSYLDEFETEVQVPTVDDLNGAADGILRLQQTYLLPTNAMANGILMEKRTNCSLLASDMQFIGTRAIQIERYASGIEWMYHAYQKVLKGDDYSIPAEVIMENLNVARNLHNAEFLRFRYIPDNLFSNLVSPNFENLAELYMPPLIKDYPLHITIDSLYDYNNFHAVCRGEDLQRIKKELRCWYSTSNSFFNILSPLPVEMHHENPIILQVYDLLSDQIVNHLKKKALPNLVRSQVQGSKTDWVTSNLRTSSVAWLFDRDVPGDKIVTKIPQIVTRATGLECGSWAAAEELQVSCYGSIGGHYVPHVDALHSRPISEDNADFPRGDRVATVMFYLSNVELGGGTAFPRLGVLAKPVKGSAIIWYNLLKNGKHDPLMLHGGCPVLYGNKWVANKWIHLLEQHHIRKCSLNASE